MSALACDGCESERGCELGNSDGSGAVRKFFVNCANLDTAGKAMVSDSESESELAPESASCTSEEAEAREAAVPVESDGGRDSVLV